MGSRHGYPESVTEVGDHGSVSGDVGGDPSRRTTKAVWKTRGYVLRVEVTNSKRILRNSFT